MQSRSDKLIIKFSSLKVYNDTNEQKQHLNSSFNING